MAPPLLRRPSQRTSPQLLSAKPLLRTKHPLNGPQLKWMREGKGVPIIIEKFPHRFRSRNKVF